MAYCGDNQNDKSETRKLNPGNEKSHRNQPDQVQEVEKKEKAADKSENEQYNLLSMFEIPVSLWHLARRDLDAFEKSVRQNYVITSSDPRAFKTNTVGKISIHLYFLSIFWQFMFFLGNVSMVLITFCLYFFPRLAIILLLALLAWWTSTRIRLKKMRNLTAQQKQELFFQSTSVLSSTKYFSMRYVWPSSVATITGPRIYARVPHGIIPYSCDSLLYFRMIFGSIPKIAAADILFKLPVLKDINIIRAVPSSMKKLGETLQNNQDVLIICDGIAGMFRASGGIGNEHVTKPRFGVAKLALLHGATIITCYAFGHNHIHTVLADKWGYLKAISRFLRISITPYLGAFGLPIGRRLPLTLAFGKAMPVVKDVKPSRKSIQELHTAIMSNMVETFNTHKHGFGWSSKELVFE
jgi:1-acyl-sn-glycerol-3-phosphate acyltransferase